MVDEAELRASKPNGGKQSACANVLTALAPLHNRLWLGNAGVDALQLRQVMSAFSAVAVAVGDFRAFAMADIGKSKTTDRRRYRVLMIAPTSFFADYGCHVRILEEARVLQHLGHRVTVATYRNGRDLPELDIRRTLPIPWRQSYEVGSSRHKLGFDVLLGIKTLQMVMRERFDVIHAHLHEGALIGLVLSRLMRIPLVFDFQGSLTEEMIDHHFLRRDSWFYGPLRRLEEAIDHAAPVVFTSSANAERILLDDFACDTAKVVALPDSVNTKVFRPPTVHDAAQLAVLRQQLGLPEGAKVIVYLGLLAAYQGTDLLLEAMQHIKAQHNDAHLLLMGFPGVDAYRVKANELGVGDRVIFTGRVPYELAPLHLQLGNVAVAPKLSLTESAGKLLNYMAIGLPTVAFDTPVAREYLGTDGLLAERGNAASLATHLLELLNDPARATVIGTRLRQRAVQHFELLNAGLAIEEVYASLVDGIPASTQQNAWADSTVAER